MMSKDPVVINVVVTLSYNGKETVKKMPMVKSNDSLYPVIYRRRPDNKGLSQDAILKARETDKCPICGTYHIHGLMEGFRTIHCAKSDKVLIDNKEVIQYRIIHYD